MHVDFRLQRYVFFAYSRLDAMLLGIYYLESFAVGGHLLKLRISRLAVIGGVLIGQVMHFMATVFECVATTSRTLKEGLTTQNQSPNTCTSLHRSSACAFDEVSYTQCFTARHRMIIDSP